MNILLFARLRERTGHDQISLALTGPCTIADVRAALQEALPDHASLFLPGQALAAVNQTLCDDSMSVAEGDEVAFFPPVTGG